MKERYVDGPRFHRATQQLITCADSVLTEYHSKGLTLTMRQLFYRLVALGEVGNSKQEYDNTQRTMTHARLAGLIDWDMIDDPTRAAWTRFEYKGPRHAMECLADTYNEDVWVDQSARVIVAVEKESMIGMVQQVCEPISVPILHTRGYPSATSLREFVKQRIMDARQQKCIVLLLSDSDSIGIDLERDLAHRIKLFSGRDVEVDRVALTSEQIEDWRVPSMYYSTTVELEAADPYLLSSELYRHITNYCDVSELKERRDAVKHTRQRIAELARTL